MQEYAARLPAVRARPEQRFTALVTTILDDAGINYLTRHRAGQERGVVRGQGRAHGRVTSRVYADPLTEITDQIGVRVITYVLSDVTAVADLLADQLILLADRDMGRETASEGRFGYASRHLQVEPGRGPRDAAGVRGASPAWAPRCRSAPCCSTRGPSSSTTSATRAAIPDEHAPDLDRRFTLAAGLLELADREFSTIRDRLQADMTGRAPEPHDDDPRIDAQDLAAFLAGQYADAGWSRTDHYEWISGLLLELGITSLEELRGVLAPGRPGGRSPHGWPTATRRAPSAGSTTACSPTSVSAICD